MATPVAVATKSVLLDNAIGPLPRLCVMKLALIATPVLALYSPIVPPVDTKSVLPDNAKPLGLFSPVMKLALIGAPVVALYSPTVVSLPT